MLAECCHYTLFNRTSTSAADGNTHLVVAAQTVQLAFDFACVAVELLATLFAVVMIRMIGFATPFDVTLVDDRVAFVTHVLAQSGRLLLRVALAAERSERVIYLRNALNTIDLPTSVAQKSNVAQLHIAHLATEALAMPTVVHGADDL